MNRVRIREINAGKVPLGEYVIGGWVRTHRQSKNVSFIELTDGSAVRGLQLVIDPKIPAYAAMADKIATGCALIASGHLVKSPAKGQSFELHVHDLNLVGEADPESYPLQKKSHSLEFLREVLHLRPRSNTIGAVVRVRSAAAMAVHQFFQERGFVYVHTPIITTADCEGAGEMFRVTTLDPLHPPVVDGRVDYSEDFFGAEAGLTVSGQLEAEIYATALSKVYTFGPTFRAENSNTTRHLSEFWMIEPEMAFCDLCGDMEIAEAFLVAIIKHILEHCREELEFLQGREWSDGRLIARLEAVTTSHFEVLEYSAAVSALEKSGRLFEFPVYWGMDLQAEHERYLTDEYIKGPVFVINYPKEIKAFYMRLNDDQKTVRAMDLLVPRLGEIIGGSQREERYEILLQKMRDMGLNEDSYWWYLDLRKYGTVEHSGFGLGFERFLMYVTDMHNIRDVIPFPRYPRYARF